MRAISRRTLAPLAGMLLVALLAAGCSDDTGTECAAPNTMCGGTCTNTNFDPSNCGTCGTTCSSDQTCSSGQCVCAGGQTDCNGTCTDTATDTANCGSCGNACDSTEICNSGTCGPPSTCESPKEICSGACVDTNSDEDNCGSCGTACSAGQTCNNGTCECPSGQTDCSGTCTNTANDPKNCGSCGTDCGSQACNNGACGGCGTLTDCSGACVDTDSDVNNCGGCGTKCDVAAGFTCTAGACACANTSYTDCSGKCVDTSADKNNCGTCGTTCTGSTPNCVSGTCGLDCGTLTDCNGVCVNTDSDNNNCGSCGVQCTGGTVCSGGTCACKAGETDCSGTCYDLQTTAAHCGTCTNACTTGQVCTAGACQTSCLPGLTACGSPATCVDLASDDNNCGTCAVKCTGGKTCVSSACACPSTLPTDCSGTCADTQTDENNCGTCGTKCAANETCSSGTCVTSPVVSVNVACPKTTLPYQGTTQCTATGVLANGSTVPLTTDSKLTWNAANNPANPVTCTGTAVVADYNTTKGLMYGNEVGCQGDVTATYGGSIVSNKVTISVIAESITGVAIVPTSPSVPWLVGNVFNGTNGCATATNQRLQVKFKLRVSYDNGTYVDQTTAATWFSSNGLAATINTNGVATIAGTTAPTANQTTTIQAAWVDTNGTNHTASTVLTVVPPTLSSITIAPATTTVPVGGSDGFKIMAVFNNSTSFDVTALGNASGDYTGWPAATLAFENTTTYLTDAGINTTTLEHEVTGKAKTPANDPETVTAKFCNSATYKTATADVTVTGGALTKCTIVPPLASCGGSTGTPCVYPKGANDVQYKACGYYSDAPTTCADITDQVVWSSLNATVATADNTTDHEGEVDMLDVGTTAIQADPSGILAGVAKCSSYVKVVNGQTCGVEIVPMFKGAVGRRAYRINPASNFPLSGGVNGPGTNDLRPRLPNESVWAWGHKFKAYAYISTSSTCATKTSGVKFDITNAATWGVTPDVAGKPALQYTGTPGTYNVIADTTVADRVDTVTAKYPLVTGSTTMETGTMQVGVCGTRVSNTLRVAAAFSDTSYSVSPVTDSYAGDTSHAYNLAQRFAGTCVLPAFTDAVGNVYSSTARTTTDYVLELSEDATVWAPANSAVATVSNQADHKGEITAVAAGTTQIRGTFGGVTAELDFTVLAAKVASCAITPTSGTLSYYAGPPIIASSQQFTATATMTDGSTKDITDSVDWSESSTGACADWSGTVDGLLTATAGAGCTTKITAVATGLGAPGNLNPACTPVNPNEPVVTSNSVTISNYFIQTLGKSCFEAGPTALTMSKGTLNDLFGCVVFTNGATEAVDLTSDDGAATWFSPTITVATVTSAGNVEAKAAGTVTIQSSYAGKTASLNLTVVNTGFTSIALTGVNKGATNCSTLNTASVTYEYCEQGLAFVQYHVIGTRTDNTTQDLTTMASYFCYQGTGTTACITGDANHISWTPIPGFVRWGVAGFSTALQTFNLSATVTPVGGTTLSTPADSATVRLFNYAPNPTGFPTGMTVTVAPKTLSGAGKYTHATAKVTYGFVNNVEVDVSNDIAYALTQNGNAATVYANPQSPLQNNGWIVSRAVTSSTTVQLEGTFLYVSPPIIDYDTFTVNP